MKDVTLVLQDGTTFKGKSFGYEQNVVGEVVFNTAMMGYPESLTDPSYAGQMMVLTYPLVGNYGVPPFTFGTVSSVETQSQQTGQGVLPLFMESDRIYATALIVADYSEQYSHWNACEGLGDWLKREKVPGVTGIDTRALTKVLREHGVMMGRLEFEGSECSCDTATNGTVEDYGAVNWVARVSCKDVIRYNEGAGRRVVLVDCGVKANIIRCLVNRGVEVIRVPWNYDYTGMDFDGLFLANGPGDPDTCAEAVEILKKQMSMSRKPICGICMGNQLLAKAGGATVYKLKYGHRSHNQPVREVGTNRCYVTSQNHGYAVDAVTLGNDWRELFVNMNDGSNEGVRHTVNPWFSSQFHPEACSGPVDTEFMFDRFIKTL
jgi:carbamoyl-phosphate synthase small subunit